MTSAVRLRPLSYAVGSGGPRWGPVPAVREPRPVRPPHRSSPARPVGLSTRATPLRSPSPARVRLHLKPGQKGTKRPLAQFGDRYDPQHPKRFKTVEFLVEGRDWQPPRQRLAPDRILALRVAFGDVTTRERVKRAGGVSNPDRRVRQLRHDRVIALGLAGRIVDDAASTPGCSGPSGEHLPTDARPPST